MKVAKKRLVAVLAALVAISVIATGCGSPSAEEPADGKQKVTVRIGVGAPLTGTGVVEFGKGTVRAAKLAAAQANESERAKAAGIKFEIVEGDDQGDPKVAVNVANQFAGDPKLVGVVGHVNSGCAIPASKIYNENTIVMISNSATSPQLTAQGFDNVFRTCTIDPVQGEFAADKFYKEIGYKTAFVVDDSTAYGEGVAQYFSERFVANGGQVLGQEKTSDKDTDFTALATKIAAAKPDVVYYGGLYPAGALLIKQLRAADFNNPISGADGFNDGELVNLAGAAAEGCYATAIGMPVEEMPKGAEFIAAYEEMFPGETVGAVDTYGFDAANAIINGVLTAAEEIGAEKVTTPEGRAAVIEAVAASDFEGLTGRVQFDANGDTLNKAVTLIVVKDGKLIPWVK